MPTLSNNGNFWDASEAALPRRRRAGAYTGGMQVELSEEAAALVGQYLERGYGSAAEVVEHALAQFAAWDAERLNVLVEEAYESAEREGWIPSEEVMAKARAIIARAQEREARASA